jgi:hypothetical protein
MMASCRVRGGRGRVKGGSVRIGTVRVQTAPVSPCRSRLTSLLEPSSSCFPFPSLHTHRPSYHFLLILPSSSGFLDEIASASTPSSTILFGPTLSHQPNNMSSQPQQSQANPPYLPIFPSPPLLATPSPYSSYPNLNPYAYPYPSSSYLLPQSQSGRIFHSSPPRPFYPDAHPEPHSTSLYQPYPQQAQTHDELRHRSGSSSTNSRSNPPSSLASHPNPNSEIPESPRAARLRELSRTLSDVALEASSSSLTRRLRRRRSCWRWVSWIVAILLEFWTVWCTIRYFVAWLRELLSPSSFALLPGIRSFGRHADVKQLCLCSGEISLQRGLNKTPTQPRLLYPLTLHPARNPPPYPLPPPSSSFQLF